MKHKHAQRNSIIIFIAAVIIIVGGIYFWRRQPNTSTMNCQEICTVPLDEEKVCTNICTTK